MTILQQIRNAIMLALNESGGPCTFTTRRWAADSQLAAGEVRGAVLFHAEQPSRVGGPGSVIVRRDHTIAVQVVTAVTDPADIDDALEDPRVWMVAKLGGNTLGGLVHELEEGNTVWETAQLARMHGAFIAQWRPRYQTRHDDLTQRH